MPRSIATKVNLVNLKNKVRKLVALCLRRQSRWLHLCYTMTSVSRGSPSSPVLLNFQTPHFARSFQRIFLQNFESAVCAFRCVRMFESKVFQPGVCYARTGCRFASYCFGLLRFTCLLILTFFLPPRILILLSQPRSFCLW